MSDLPQRILEEVLWTFEPILYVDRQEFDQAIRDHHVRIVETAERWRPQERVLPVTKILLCFECWEEDDEVEATIELETTDPAGWTALDLMFAVHQRLTDYLTARRGTLGDHCFFEGLSLRSVHRGVPVYDLDLGS